MYSYNDVEKIKINLEWIVHQSSVFPWQLDSIDQKAIYALLELIRTYDLLLVLISQRGVSVIDAEISEGLSLTEEFIDKFNLRQRTL